MIDDLPIGQRLWWQAILIIGNMTMGAFVMTAVATRFVFPSVSLEGQTFWDTSKVTPYHTSDSEGKILVLASSSWLYLLSYLGLRRTCYSLRASHCNS